MTLPPTCDWEAEKGSVVKQGRTREKAHNELESRLKTRSEGVAGVVGFVEHVVEAAKNVLETRLRLDEVDENIVRHRKEDVVQIANNKKLGCLAL
jgi:hypothetical protein